MIIGFVGSLGQGKTCSMTRYGLKFNNQGRSTYVVSNYDTQFTDKYVSNPMELEQISKQQSGVQLLDEVWSWADSRESGENDTFNNMIINSRKRGWIVLYTTQKLHMVDKRLRDNTDFIVLCSHYESKVDWSGDFDLVKLEVFKNSELGVEHHNTVQFKANPLYDVYDTFEEVATEDTTEMYDQAIEEAKERLRNGEYEYKKDVISFLTIDHGMSQTKADLVATKVMNEVEQ